MDITKIWMSQNNLRRAKQIPAMIETIRSGGILPPIVLMRCEDGEIQVEDGHHRLTAIWISGKTELDYNDYFMVEKDQWKPRRGRIDILEIYATPTLYEKSNDS